MHALKAQWASFATQWVPPHADAPGIFDELAGLYAQPHRHYHTLAHVANLLEAFRNAKPDVPLADPLAIEFAIWFHDAVYDPKRNDNEEQSARLARHVMGHFFPPQHEILHSVYQLIMSTQKHRPAVHHYDCLFFIDLDLGIFGAPPEQYMRYAEQIRLEYSMYPAFIYRQGRRQALKHFLSRPNIYHTPAFRNALEGQARENLSAEIAML
jgi:predicted metal-dependent HD superfamily phosphohydrolase